MGARNILARLTLSFIVITGLGACAPLPNRNNSDAFQIIIRDEVPSNKILSLIGCISDELETTDNSTKHEFVTTQKRRDEGYRLERRWGLKQSLITLSIDINKDGSVYVFENTQLKSIAPFVSTSQELVKIKECLVRKS